MEASPDSVEESGLDHIVDHIQFWNIWIQWR